MGRSGVTLRTWAGWGTPDPGVQGRTQPRASGEEEEGRLVPGPRGRGMRRAGALVLGTWEVQRCPPPHGDCWRPAIPPERCSRLPGGRGCGERRAPHPLAHTPREHAQCGPGNFLPSRERPWPPPGPQLAKLGVTGCTSWGRGARLSPAFRRPGSLPRLCSAPRLFSRQTLPRQLGTEACMSSTVPRGQFRGRVARGLTVWLPNGGTLWRGAHHAH